MHELSWLENMREISEKHAKSQGIKVMLEVGKLSSRGPGRLAVWLLYGHERPVQCAGQFNSAIQIIKSSAAKGDNFFG